VYQRLLYWCRIGSENADDSTHNDWLPRTRMSDTMVSQTCASVSSVLG
jgi:hypothetical protein